MSGFYQAPSNQQVSVHSFTNAPITFIAKTTINFMQRHYMMTFLWAIGLLIVSFAKGYTVDPNTQYEFDKALDEAERIEHTHLNDAYINSDAQYQRYYRTKGWFSCDAYCQQTYRDYLESQQQLSDAKVCKLSIDILAHTQSKNNRHCTMQQCQKRDQKLGFSQNMQ